jgi:hypothetical protein
MNFEELPPEVQMRFSTASIDTLNHFPAPMGESTFHLEIKVLINLFTEDDRITGPAYGTTVSRPDSNELYHLQSAGPVGTSLVGAGSGLSALPEPVVIEQKSFVSKRARIARLGWPKLDIYEFDNRISCYVVTESFLNVFREFAAIDHTMIRSIASIEKNTITAIGEYLLDFPVVRAVNYLKSPAEYVRSRGAGGPDYYVARPHSLVSLHDGAFRISPVVRDRHSPRSAFASHAFLQRLLEVGIVGVDYDVAAKYRQIPS